MLFLYENVAAVAVALSASLVAWLFGGARGDLIALVVPWLLLLVLEVLFFFPQRMQGESIYAARSRVWRALRSSAIAWISLGFVCLLLIPFVNKGLCPGCDAAAIAAGSDPSAPIPFLPSCVDRRMHLTTFLWFAFVLSSVLVVRHALQRDGRRLVLNILVWNGVALALFGFIQGMTNAPGPFWTALQDRMPPRHAAGLFFSVFGYPNMAGDYFTLLFGVSVALWRARSEKASSPEPSKDDLSERASATTRRFEKFVKRHYLLIPAVLFFFSALCTLSRAAILLVSASACVYFLHTLSFVLCRMDRSRRVVIGVWGVLVFSLIVFFSVLFMPQDMRREVDSLDSYEVLDRMTGKRQHHVQVANAIWTDHFLFGCGGWGYAHLCGPKLRELKLPRGSLNSVGSANVHNDYLQFLAEHGMVGFACLTAILVLLLLPVFRQVCAMYRAYRFQRRKLRLPKPLQIFIIPPPVFIILVACLATLIHAFGDCPLRSLAILDLLYVSIAALPGFMP